MVKDHECVPHVFNEMTNRQTGNFSDLEILTTNDKLRNGVEKLWFNYQFSYSRCGSISSHKQVWDASKLFFEWKD